MYGGFLSIFLTPVKDRYIWDGPCGGFFNGQNTRRKRAIARHCHIHHIVYIHVYLIYVLDQHWKYHDAEHKYKNIKNKCLGMKNFGWCLPPHFVTLPSKFVHMLKKNTSSYLHPGRFTWNLQITHHFSKANDLPNFHDEMFHVNSSGRVTNSTVLIFVSKTATVNQASSPWNEVNSLHLGQNLKSRLENTWQKRHKNGKMLKEMYDPDFFGTKIVWGWWKMNSYPLCFLIA